MHRPTVILLAASLFAAPIATRAQSATADSTFLIGDCPTRSAASRIVLAMVIDTAGRVMPGTVSIGQSTDPALSAWGCTIAFDLRFTPALLAGKPVNATGEQPLSFNARVINRRP